MRFQIMIFALFVSTLFYCGNDSPEDKGQDSEKSSLTAADSMPPIKEIDGMDNQEGYKAPQYSTEVKKEVPILSTDEINAMDGEDDRLDFYPDRYSYNFLENPVVTKKERVQLNDQEVTYTNRPPIFDNACLESSDNSLSCSNKKVAEYLEMADINTEGGFVTIVVNAKGKVSQIEKIHLPNINCQDCVDQIKERVQSMPDWMPAIQAGEAVAVRIRLPLNG